MQKYFYSKLLLFGEYTIITGGEALAMPLQKFRGYWAQTENKSLQQNLPGFAEYLSENNFTFLNIESFKKDLDTGWYFESNIPTGYGAGSSGALVAGVLKKYGNPVFLQRQPITDLKNIVARMEGYFHGSSSGTDPLISFLNQAIHLKAGDIFSLQLPKRESNLTFFLLDTKHPRKTGPFVNYFVNKMKVPDFAEKVNQELKEFNRLAIKSYIQNDEANLLKNFKKISRFQFEYFQKMIPEFLTDIWAPRLESDLYNLKICGAGGGGFMIGLTQNWEETQRQTSNYDLIKLNI